ncbi:MAG: InlB B-repeat-containing protein, partial [Clostridia bacterium]|nr:InlB B-repeat-containing protein [Clostridia bacterium]
MKRFNKIISIALAILTVMMPLTIIPVSAATHSAYYNELLDLGFTDSYATKLEELHKMHPTWIFEPVMITDLNSKFTFTYVTNSENAKSGSSYPNLVTTETWAPSPWTSLGNKNYSPYYDSSVTTLFDSGWRKASLAAVKYFMDPRNFLNDVDIFMFETLEFNAATQTVDRVAAALKGSFMGNGAKCDNGKTYAQYIWEVGKANNISPIFLASRLKQEQGSGSSPLVNGTIGTKLYSYYTNKPSTDNGDPVWGTVKKTDTYTKSYLIGFDGYYNFFNIGACGTGRFAIFLNGGKEAQEGGWNTKAKAISGGSKKIAAKYVGDYQDTLYFQKFNTDPRSSRVLWGQYMQNISAPLTEGRNTRKTYASEGVLEEAYVFKIPVYGGMSTTPYADPAKGNSYYSPSKSTGYTGGGSSPYAPTAKTFTARYDANGGTGTMEDTIVTYGTSTALRANTFTRTGYDFAGWYRYRTSDNKWHYSNGTTSAWYVEGTQPDGYTKLVLSDKSKVSMTSSVDKDVCIFYAAWEANNYTVEFNANGGTGTMANLAMTYGTAKALTKNAFTRSGYTFLGWAKTADAATAAYTDAKSVKNLTSTAGETVTLYAVWQENVKTF